MRTRTWDEREQDVLTLVADLKRRDTFAQVDDDTLKTIAKWGDDLCLSAEPLIRLLVFMGAIYLRELDPKTLNVIRGVTGGNVNLEGPGYDLPF